MRRDEIALSDPPTNDRPGDHWMCGLDHAGASCPGGPNADGVCPLADACRPRRTWSGQVRRLAIAGLALAAVVTFFAIQPSTAPSVLKPGELSTPHAQILAGTLTTSRCAACHPSAATSPATWFFSAGDGHQDVSQTNRCLDCHHKVITRERATFAHNLPGPILNDIRSRIRLASTRSDQDTWHDWMPGPAVDQQNVQCSACHREHRGAEGDLLAISNEQCQSCHTDRFGSFADSHPDWTQWPYGRGGKISFNHQTHALDHYPKTIIDGRSTSFQCSTCHHRDSDGELVRSPSFEQGCQSCHDQSLTIESATGLEFVALPTVQNRTADAVVAWPESATGFFDGRLPPLAELLLRSDQATAVALRRIPNSDFSRLNEDDPEAIEAAEIVARASRELLKEFGRRGHDEITERAAASGVSPQLIIEILRALSPQWVEETYQNWFDTDENLGHGTAMVEPWLRTRGLRLVDYQDMNFPPPSFVIATRPQEDSLLSATTSTDELAEDDLLVTSSANDTSGDDTLGGDLLLADPPDDDLLSADPLADSLDSAELDRDEPVKIRFDADSMLPGGGWYRDDVRLSIAYRGNGHSDSVLRATVALLSQLPQSDPLRKRLLANRAISACVSCHPAAAEERGNWTSSPLIGRRSDFTKFAHGPHLNIAQLSDCSYCHSFDPHKEPRESNVTLAGSRNTGSNPHEFAPLERQACAACHRAKAAGDNCTTCHRYHIE